MKPEARGRTKIIINTTTAKMRRNTAHAVANNSTRQRHAAAGKKQADDKTPEAVEHLVEGTVNIVNGVTCWTTTIVVEYSAEKNTKLSNTRASWTSRDGVDP